MQLLKNIKLDIKSTWWISLLIILLFFHSRHLLNSDEGVILEGAWNLINNKKLYIDFFEFIPPGGFYIVFWAWKIFGTHYFIAKLLAIITIFLSSVGVYKISRQILKNDFSHLPSFIFVVSSIYWPIINHNTFNILFIVWAIYFFLKGLSNYTRNYFILSGLFTGLAILFLQQKGIVLLIALSTFLFILSFKEKKYLLKPIFYYLISSLSVVALLVIKWPAKLLYENLIVFPLFNYTETNKISPFLFIIFLTILFLIAWGLRKEKSKKIWGLIFIQFFLLLSALPRPDFYHIALITFPIYPLLILVFGKIKLIKGNIKHNCHLTIYFAASGIILLTIAAPLIINIYYFPIFYSMKGDESISYIKNNCKDSNYLYAGPFIPGLYFETEKLNATRYPFLITNQHTKKQFSEAREMLSKNKPSCAILKYNIVEKFNYNKNNPVDKYIFDNYKIVFQKNNTLIFQATK